MQLEIQRKGKWSVIILIIIEQFLLFYTHLSLVPFVIQIAKVENDTAKSMLDNTKMRTEIDLLEKKKSALASEMAAKDQMVAKIQAEITKNNSLIKRKTDQMEHLNSKIDKMLLAAGGVELSPMESLQPPAVGPQDARGAGPVRQTFARRRGRRRDAG